MQLSFKACEDCPNRCSFEDGGNVEMDSEFVLTVCRKAAYKPRGCPVK